VADAKQDHTMTSLRHTMLLGSQNMGSASPGIVDGKRPDCVAALEAAGVREVGDHLREYVFGYCQT
jgi:hypothetical protein